MSELEEKIKKASLAILSKLSPRLKAEELEATGKLLVESLAVFLQEEEEKSNLTEFLKICSELAEKGFFPGTSGNLSLLKSEKSLLITPSGVRKQELKADDLVELDLKGNQLYGRKKASSEAKMHYHIYQRRPEIKAVVHAHPPFATGFAAARIPLDAPVLPEAILILGKVPLVEYATPGTREVPESLDPYLSEGTNAFLLANHGALTLGESLAQAAHRMETLELFAKVLLIARMLGGEKLLGKEELEKLAKAHPTPPKD